MDLTGPEAFYLASVRGSSRPLSVYARLEFPNESPGWLDREIDSARPRLRRTRIGNGPAWYARVYAAARRLVAVRRKSAGVDCRYVPRRASLAGTPTGFL